MTTLSTGRRRTVRRSALIGFGIGFVMAFVATVLALAFVLFESLEGVLVPGATLLSPLADTMARWNGLLTMLLTGLVNGLVYAAVLALAATLLTALRREDEPYR